MSSGDSRRLPPRTGFSSSLSATDAKATKPERPAPRFPLPEAMAFSAGISREREFEFTNADFDQIRKLIHEHAGIVLSPAKQDMVYSRLARRLRACGDRSFLQYLNRLGRDRAEWETFVNSLTTNLTSFFRESHHFDVLAEQMKGIVDKRTIKIWCCAASTGEEPYSLAMTACEAFDSLNPPVQITATDIDTTVLAQGEAGLYRQERVDRLSPERLRRFFLRGADVPAGMVKVKPELRRLITFRRINLLDSVWSVQGPLDAIFCRNVMIYFDKPTQHTILKRFAPLLRADGQLFVGHSESFVHAADLFRSCGRTVYRLADRPSR